jgi:hypothetical protein
VTPLDLRALLDSLHAHGVSFVVIGGRGSWLREARGGMQDLADLERLPPLE